jgi:putative lipase involved disintegration of autophagic bodies
VAFRGTQSNANIIADTKLKTHNISDVCKNCKVHRGFHTAWNQTSKTVIDTVLSARMKYPHMEVVFIGHSLGGAIATIGAAVLRAANVPVTLVCLLKYHCFNWCTD